MQTLMGLFNQKVSEKKETNMGFESKLHDDVLIVSVGAKRATIDVSPDFKEYLLKEIDQGNTKIVVDLSAAEFVDSSFLGALVTGLKRAAMKNGDLKIVGLQPPVQAMFELTRLYRIFDIFKNIDDAVNSF